jgi:3-oxoacyl-[acyl-carrier-protein] synthase-3
MGWLNSCNDCKEVMKKATKFKVKIVGTGSYLPERVITNQQLHNLYETHPHWPENYLGIKQRHWVIDEKTSDLAAKAGEKAIQDSNIEKSKVDLLIVATSTPDKLAPSTASITANKLGLSCPCFDVNAVCSGFLYALNIASSFIETNTYTNILLIASETYSTITDTSSRDSVYFGDGAAAVVITKAQTGWIYTKLYSDPKGIDGFVTNIGEYFKMDGKAVFEAGINNLPKAIKEVVEDVEVGIDKVKYLIPHQPGIKMLQNIAEQVNLPFEKVITVMDRYANVAAASIPIALTDSLIKNKIENNDLILMASIGSGWTWGTGVIKWEK